VDSSPDNDGTDQHCQMGRARQARQKAYARNQRLNAPQETHQPNLADMGWAVARLPRVGSGGWRTRKAGQCRRPRGLGEVCGVTEAMLQGHSWAPTCRTVRE
jgi:hypothetical protein